jgi:hypothetical protein
MVFLFTQALFVIVQATLMPHCETIVSTSKCNFYLFLKELLIVKKVYTLLKMVKIPF